jgi:hypothetical protein
MMIGVPESCGEVVFVLAVTNATGVTPPVRVYESVAYASYGAADPVFLAHTWMLYVPPGKPVVVHVNGLVPYAEPVQASVTGLNTQSWYSATPEPPVATAAKLIKVPGACGDAGLGVAVTAATGVTTVFGSTFTVIGADVAVAPWLLVTLAVTGYTPTGTLAQLTVYGDVVALDIRFVPK